MSIDNDIEAIEIEMLNAAIAAAKESVDNSGRDNAVADTTAIQFQSESQLNTTLHTTGVGTLSFTPDAPSSGRATDNKLLEATCDIGCCMCFGECVDSAPGGKLGSAILFSNMLMLAVWIAAALIFNDSGLEKGITCWMLVNTSMEHVITSFRSKGMMTNVGSEAFLFLPSVSAAGTAMFAILKSADTGVTTVVVMFFVCLMISQQTMRLVTTKTSITVSSEIYT